MANLADCAVAIAKEDIKKLKRGIVKARNHKDGYDEVFSYDVKYIESGKLAHITEKWHVVNDGANSENSKTYVLDECSMPKEVFDEKYRNKLTKEYDTWKVVEHKEWSNGWEINWKLLNSCPYQSDTNVQEYDDHITIYFGGRWGFPQDLEDTLNRAGVRWQGAVAEDGCEVYDSELGNEDFGLRLVVCGEDKDWHCVEDQTGVK